MPDELPVSAVFGASQGKRGCGYVLGFSQPCVCFAPIVARGERRSIHNPSLRFASQLTVFP